MSSRAFIGTALLALLLAATLGEGGATPLASFAIHGGVVLLLLAALILPAAAGAGERARGLSRVPLAAWITFLALAAAGALLAPYRYAAYLTLVELATFFAAAFLAARSGAEILRLAAAILLWGGAAQGLLAAYQSLALNQVRPAGTFLNPNHLAGWLVALIALGLAGQDRPASRVALTLRAAAAGTAALGVFLSGSRGALLGLAAAGAVLAPGAWRSSRSRGRRVLLAAVSCLVLIAALSGVALRLARASDPFLYNRIRIWRASLELAAESPWMGSGPGQFAARAANLNFPLEQGPLRYERFFVSPHSEFLRVPCEFGWPAALACLAAAGLAGIEIRRRIRVRELPASAIGAGAALAALGAQALVDDLGDRPALYLLAAVLLGGCLSTARPAEARIGMNARLALGALLVSLFVAAEALPLLALADLTPSRVWGPRHAPQDLPRGRLDAAGRARLESSLARNPLHPDTWLRRAEDLAGEDRDWSPAVYAQAREAAEQAIRLEPTHKRYWLGLARIERLACLGLYGDEASRDRAQRAYEQAQQRARHDPFVALEEGRFLLLAGDPTGARRAAERALSIEPQALPARLLLADALLIGGGKLAAPRARKLLEEAQTVARRWADAPRQTPYARQALDLDPAWRSSIEARLAAVESAP